MEFRKGILFIRLKGDLNKDTIKGIIDKDFKYVVLNIDDMYSIDSYSIKYLNKIYKLYENYKQDKENFIEEFKRSFLIYPTNPTIEAFNKVGINYQELKEGKVLKRILNEYKTKFQSFFHYLGKKQNKKCIYI